jgi:hypothetical protein
MIKKILLLSALYFNRSRIIFAQTHFIHSHSGTSSNQLAVWAAKDLNLFTKYGLDVDLVFISGGARMVAWGGHTVFNSDGVAPVHAIPLWR